MLTFTVVRYKNLLSVGNWFVEVPLNQYSTTCVIGSNGSSKSALTDAITFALFGKPFRDINKPALVNSQNKRNCLVEIEFTVNGKNYKVVRGIKPNIFEIHENGILINQESTVKDYQNYLEKFILRMTFKSFSQIVILGSTSYIPFMKLNPADRRTIIEDLLDIQIFSVMSQLIKERVANNTKSIQLVKHQIELLKQKFNIKKKHLEELQTNIQLEIDAYDVEIAHNNTTIDNLTDTNNKINEQINYIQHNVIDKLGVEQKYKQLIKLESQLENSLNNLQKDVHFFNHHEFCPTCKQSIENEFKESEIVKINDKIEKQRQALNELTTKLTEQKNKLLEISQQQNVIQEYQIQVASNNSQITEKQRYISILQKKIEQLQEPRVLDEMELTNIENELSHSIEEYESLHEEKEYLETATILLKENGVKSKIIANYLPVINKLINKYLEEFDFFVNFNLNEEFKEEIRARHKDVFSYQSFSDGEKMRIDLSILQTWRQISRLKNSVNTNLLIIDELLDNALDSAGTEVALGLIDRLGKEGNNLFILSPKGENYSDRFDHIIKFEKIKGFSRIAKS
jgi:DNA repair exonuclease SbcCD ATPase subunit